MTRFTGWLAHLDHPTTDGRTLVTPFNSGSPVPEGWLPLFGPGLPQVAVGVVREVWIEDDWLRCRGELTLGALPVGYRVPKVGAEIDVDSGTATTVWRGDEQQLILRDWTLRAVTIGDRPAWPDARLELEL